MADKEVKSKVEKYNWFQISNILRLGVLDREVVKVKYFDELLSEEEWKKVLRKDGLNF